MSTDGPHPPNNSVSKPETSKPDAARPELTNRALSLSEKVRSLRLADKIGKREGGASGGMVWALLVLLILLSGAVGYNVYATQTALQKIETLEKKAADLAKKSEGEEEGGGEVVGGQDKDEIALRYKGFVVPIATILVSPQVGGKILKLAFQEGQNVKADDFLAEIEAVEYQADFDKAFAQVKAASARLNILKKFRGPEIEQVATRLADLTAQEKQAEYDLRRVEVLHARGATPKQELEAAKAKYDSTLARKAEAKLALALMVQGPRDEQIEAAKAELDGAIADAAKAQWRLGNTIIKAPVNGTILTKKAEENNQVNPAAFSNGLSASLCEMADLTELEVDVAVVERDRPRVKVNQECRVRVDAWPGKIYEGYVSRIMPTADRGKNAIPVRVKIVRKRLAHDFDNGGPFLLPEMSATVTFLNREVDPKAFEK